MSGDEIPTRVLVVDDDRIVADSLALILRGRGFEARAAYSGEDAAEIAHLWEPDAVISDVMMGRMDGVALAIYLAKELPQCKVLLMSGHAATSQLIEESRKLGHDFPLVAKPFPPNDLFDFLGPAAGNA